MKKFETPEIEVQKIELDDVLTTSNDLSGETEEDFALTVDFAKKAKFLMIHVFPYSERRGTVAATL